MLNAVQAATILERRRREALPVRDAPQRSERADLASAVLSWQRTLGNQRVARALAAGGEPRMRARPQPAAGDLALAGALSRAAAARVTRCPGYEEDETCPCELGLEASEEPRLARQPVDAGTPAAGVGPPEPTDAGSPAPVDAGAPSGGAPAPAAPALSITRTGGNGISFISTDSITLAATQPAPATGAPPEITWTVTSASANSGTGTPHTGKGAAFSFRPNPTRRPTAGSRAANPPIKYRVEAKAGAASAGFDLEQDEADTIRQEYVDYRVHVPDRSIVVAPTIATYNTGNYSLIVDGGMDTHLAATTAEFARLTQAAAPHPAPPPAAGSGSGSAAPPPAPAPVPVPAIRVTSGYRNPQRNKDVGSVLPASNHVMGHALDLAVAGANATLWARLRNAGGVSATSICEHGPTQVECNAANVDHVHIGW
jgi:Peptidase M15